jgi:hypothetical protein
MIVDRRVVERLALPRHAARKPRDFRTASGGALAGGAEVVRLGLILHGAGGTTSAVLPAVCYIAEIAPLDVICSNGWLRQRRLSVVPHEHCVVTDQGMRLGGDAGHKAGSLPAVVLHVRQEERMDAMVTSKPLNDLASIPARPVSTGSRHMPEATCEEECVGRPASAPTLQT